MKEWSENQCEPNQETVARGGSFVPINFAGPFYSPGSEAAASSRSSIAGFHGTPGTNLSAFHGVIRGGFGSTGSSHSSSS